MSNYVPAPPQENLNEHLNFFNENLATGFDDLFNNDFDLLFDPLVMTTNSGAAASQNQSQQTAAPTMPASVVFHTIPAEPMQHHENHMPQQHKCEEVEPIPYSVPSITTTSCAARYPQRSAAAVPVAVSSNPHVDQGVPALVTPPAPAKSVVSENVLDKVPASSSYSAKAPSMPKINPRKRSHSVVTDSATTSETKAAPVDTSNMSFQEQEALRRERNRHHAKRSRQRKRNYMNQLEDAVNDMRKENERLFELLGMDSARAKQDMRLDEERKSAAATEKFIQGLRQPRNRVLDNTTLAFLRELWK